MKQQQSSIQLEESHCNEHLLVLTVSIIQPFLVNIFLVKLPSFLLSSVRLGANKPHLALGMCPDWNKAISRVHLPDYHDQFRFGHPIQTAKKC